MDCLWVFIALLTFLGEVLMGFTTRKLATLVKLMSNKNIAEERSHLHCPASCTRAVQPTQARALQNPGLGVGAVPPDLLGVSGLGVGPFPKPPWQGTAGAESCASCGTCTGMTS